MTGNLMVNVSSGFAHSGIILEIKGEVTLQLSAKSVGLFEAFYNSIKPVELIDYKFPIQNNGKISKSNFRTPFPFLSPSAFPNCTSLGLPSEPASSYFVFSAPLGLQESLASSAVARRLTPFCVLRFSASYDIVPGRLLASVFSVVLGSFKRKALVLSPRP